MFAVLAVIYIVNEYTHKTILVMFSYPLDRRKLILAKLLLITALVMCSMILGYICCSVFIVIVDRYKLYLKQAGGLHGKMIFHRYSLIS